MTTGWRSPSLSPVLFSYGVTFWMPVSIPLGTRFLAFDEYSRSALAYDEKRIFLGSLAPVPSTKTAAKRQDAGPNCAPLREDEVRRLPGWHAISDYATQNWGKDWDRTLTNPPEYPDTPATGCVSGSTAAMTLDDTPSCTDSSSEESATGSVSYSKGSTSTAQFVVTGAAAFPDVSDFTVPLNMPLLHANLDLLPTTLTINNVILSTATVNNNDTAPTSIDVPSKCSLSLTSTTCTAHGSTRIRAEAKGWMWFNYPSQRDGHYKWAVSIEAVITDIEQRSSYMSVNASMTSSGITAHRVQCLSVPVGATPIQPESVNGTANATGTTDNSPYGATSSTNKEAGSGGGVPLYAAVLIPTLVFAFALAVAIGVWTCYRMRSRRRMASRHIVQDTAAVPVVLPPPSHTAPANEKYRAWMHHIEASSNSTPSSAPPSS